MKYEVGERDLVMLQHKFVVEWQDGKTVCFARAPIICGAALMSARRTLSPRPWRRMETQLVTPPWLSLSAFLAVLLLSWFSMVSSTRLVYSDRIPRISAILFVSFWRRKVLGWLRRFCKSRVNWFIAHRSIVELHLNFESNHARTEDQSLRFRRPASQNVYFHFVFPDDLT